MHSLVLVVVWTWPGTLQVPMWSGTLQVPMYMVSSRLVVVGILYSLFIIKLAIFSTYPIYKYILNCIIVASYQIIQHKCAVGVQYYRVLHNFA